MLWVMQEYPLETRVFAWDDSIIYIIFLMERGVINFIQFKKRGPGPQKRLSNAFINLSFSKYFSSAYCV